MAIELPAYDWDLHEGLRVSLEMFSRILHSMRTEGMSLPCEDGLQYMKDFYEAHVPVIPGAETLPQIGMQPLIDGMFRNSLSHGGVCVMRAENIVTYLENMSVIFPGEQWAGKVDGEIAARGIEIEGLADDLRAGMAVYGSEKMPYHDMTIYRQSLGGIEHAQFCHDELVQSRIDGRDYLAPDHRGLKPVFNLAGRQTVLAIVTQRYATSAARLAENTIQVLLGITTMPKGQQSALSVRINELCAMAEHMMITADLALDEGERLARDSYTAREYGKPIFRAEPLSSSRQYPGSRPQ